MIKDDGSYIEIKAYGTVVRISHPHSDRAITNEVQDGWFDDFISAMKAIGFSDNIREIISRSEDE